MKQKLLFFDIDGTLLSEKTHQVPQSAINALKQAKKNGHMIFINTGRTRSTINQCIEEINPDGYVCGCGTYISHLNHVLYHHQVSKQTCHQLLSLLKNQHIDAIFEASDKVYFPQDLSDPKINYFYKQYNNASFPLGFLSDKDVHLDKFCIQFYQDVSSFYHEIESQFNIIKRKKDFSEIVPKGHSKATGIQYLIDYFHLSLDDCYVFGDSMNDISMLTYVKHSIVMKNSDQPLFEITEYITDDVDNDGIEKALKHFHLI